MIACGWMMWKHCPKNIDGLVGYRTSRSMRNMDTWKFELPQINDAARLVHEGQIRGIRGMVEGIASTSHQRLRCQRYP